MTIADAYAPATLAAAGSTYGDIGPVACGFDIEDAVIDTLKAWLPRYIAAIEGQKGWEVGATPGPRGWAITGRDLQKLNSDQYPCVALLQSGIAAVPRKEGEHGIWSGVWVVDIASIFAAAWGRESRRHAQLYAAAVRLALTQIPLVGLPAEVDWRGESYDELDFADSRSYSASVCRFFVQVREAGRADGGPPPGADPPVDPTVPWDGWVQIVQTSTTVTPTNPSD